MAIVVEQVVGPDRIDNAAAHSLVAEHRGNGRYALAASSLRFGHTVTAVDTGALAHAAAGTATNGSVCSANLWGRAGIPEGEATTVVNFSTNFADSIGGLLVLSGVDQVTPTSDAQTRVGTLSGVSDVSVPNCQAGDLVVALLSIRDEAATPTITPAAGAIRWNDRAGAGDAAGVCWTIPVAATGAQPVNVTFSASIPFALVAVRVRQQATVALSGVGEGQSMAEGSAGLSDGLSGVAAGQSSADGDATLVAAPPRRRAGRLLRGVG